MYCLVKRAYSYESLVYTTVLISPLGLFSFLGWSGTESTITGATTGLLYQPRMMIDD
jgi:hypothetical protein